MATTPAPANTDVIPATLMGLVRIAAGTVAGFLVQHGVTTADNTQAIVGWITAAASGAWAIYAYWQAHQKLKAAIAAPAVVTPANH